MAYVPVPKDLTKVKTKVAFNLTKRQLVCFGGGALLGVPLFFLLRGSAGNSTAAPCDDVRDAALLPAGDVRKAWSAVGKDRGQYHPRHGDPPPDSAPTAPTTSMPCWKRQANLDKEVYDIVHGNQKAGCTGCSEKRGKNRAAGQTKKKAVPRRRKQIEAAIARANRTDKKKKSAQDSIPYERMWPDGICKVSDGRYTRKPFSSRTSTTSSARTRTRPRSLTAGATSSIIFDSSIQFELSFLNLAASEETFARAINILSREMTLTVSGWSTPPCCKTSWREATTASSRPSI